MSIPSEFGLWNTWEERLTELNSRLLAWHYEGDLDELFQTAQRRFQDLARPTLKAVTLDPGHAKEIVERSPIGIILLAFEQALNDLDHILEQTQGIANELRDE